MTECHNSFRARSRFIVCTVRPALQLFPFFISLNLCLGFQVTVPHDFLTFARLQVPSFSAKAYNQYVCFSSS